MNDLHHFNVIIVAIFIIEKWYGIKITQSLSVIRMHKLNCSFLVDHSSCDDQMSVKMTYCKTYDGKINAGHFCVRRKPLDDNPLKKN